MKKMIITLLLLSSFTLHAETLVYFSPAGGCTEAIVKEISGARSSIDIMMYSLSSRPISGALIKAKSRGVTIRILADKGQRKQHYTSCRYLINQGLDVRYDTGKGLMHNKVGIIDGKVLITGSFNWTAQAEKRNAENLLIIKDEDLIEKYQAVFDRLWEKVRE